MSAQELVSPEEARALLDTLDAAIEAACVPNCGRACRGCIAVDDASDAMTEAARPLAQTVIALSERLAAVEAERDRLARACVEGLPREVLPCPKCGFRHVDGADGSEYGTRPHHTHQCHRCGHVWDVGRWSYGALREDERLARLGSCPAVYTRVHRGGSREVLVRVGRASVNSDGSLSIHLDAFPASGELVVRRENTAEVEP